MTHDEVGSVREAKARQDLRRAGRRHHAHPGQQLGRRLAPKRRKSRSATQHPASGTRLADNTAPKRRKTRGATQHGAGRARALTTANIVYFCHPSKRGVGMDRPKPVDEAKRARQGIHPRPNWYRFGIDWAAAGHFQLIIFPRWRRLRTIAAKFGLVAGVLGVSSIASRLPVDLSRETPALPGMIPPFLARPLSESSAHGQSQNEQDS